MNRLETLIIKALNELTNRETTIAVFVFIFTLLAIFGSPFQSSYDFFSEIFNDWRLAVAIALIILINGAFIALFINLDHHHRRR